MIGVPVPQVDGPTVQLCYLQERPNGLEPCDRANGHGGDHSWQSAERLAAIAALPTYDVLVTTGPLQDDTTYHAIPARGTRGQWIRVTELDALLAKAAP